MSEPNASGLRQQRAGQTVRVDSGRFIASTNEERWWSWEDFANREDAIAYGNEILAPDEIEDGQSFYTGMVERIPSSELAEAALDSTRMLEAIDEYLHEQIGESAEDGLSVTDDQLSDLDARVQGAVKQWLDDHAIEPNCYRIVAVQTHTFHRCADTKPLDDGALVRCARPHYHAGDHLWE